MQNIKPEEFDQLFQQLHFRQMYQMRDILEKNIKLKEKQLAIPDLDRANMIMNCRIKTYPVLEG